MNVQIEGATKQCSTAASKRELSYIMDISQCGFCTPPEVNDNMYFRNRICLKCLDRRKEARLANLAVQLESCQDIVSEKRIREEHDLAPIRWTLISS